MAVVYDSKDALLLWLRCWLGGSNLCRKRANDCGVELSMFVVMLEQFVGAIVVVRDGTHKGGRRLE